MQAQSYPQSQCFGNLQLATAMRLFLKISLPSNKCLLLGRMKKDFEKEKHYG